MAFFFLFASGKFLKKFVFLTQLHLASVVENILNSILIFSPSLDQLLHFMKHKVWIWHLMLQIYFENLFFFILGRWVISPCHFEIKGRTGSEMRKRNGINSLKITFKDYLKKFNGISKTILFLSIKSTTFRSQIKEN